MDDGVKALFERALDAQKKAYAPYSNYHVAAAVRADDGMIYAGCNVENVAYPLGSCAEAGAVAQMIMGGAKRLEEVLILGPAGDACTPCGGCRQRLREFGTPDLKIHIANPQGVVMSVTLGALLPHAFGPDLGQGK